MLKRDVNYAKFNEEKRNNFISIEFETIVYTILLKFRSFIAYLAICYAQCAGRQPSVECW